MLARTGVPGDLDRLTRQLAQTGASAGTVMTAERPSSIPADARSVLTERAKGRFIRRLALSDALDAAATEAVYDNGVLTLRIPLAGHAKPRKITVSGGAAKQLTA